MIGHTEVSRPNVNCLITRQDGHEVESRQIRCMNFRLKMNQILSFLLLLNATILFTQPFPAKIYHETRENGAIAIYANNEAFHPVTAIVSAEFNHLETEIKFPATFLIPAQIDKHLLTVLRPIKNRSWTFRMGSRLFMGDINLAKEYKSEFIYSLPVATGKGCFISQGYNGKLSHQGENALDFDLPIGSPIYAARGGIVVKVIDHHRKSCPDESCNAYNNIIVIYHRDGTFAEYVHLDKDGSDVVVGQKVAAGDQIGRSGNTGWTTGPHLHFAVYLPTKEGRRTLRTLFQLNTQAVELVAGQKLP